MKKQIEIIKTCNLKRLNNQLHTLLLLFLLGITTFYGQVKNIGIPEIRNYKRTDYKGGTQSWDIEQDKDGNMYFAGRKRPDRSENGSVPFLIKFPIDIFVLVVCPFKAVVAFVFTVNEPG